MAATLADFHAMLHKGNLQPLLGPNGWEKWCIKDLFDKVLQLILDLHNYSIINASFPGDIKDTHLTYFHKCRIRTDLSNWRGLLISNFLANSPIYNLAQFQAPTLCCMDGCYFWDPSHHTAWCTDLWSDEFSWWTEDLESLHKDSPLSLEARPDERFRLSCPTRVLWCMYCLWFTIGSGRSGSCSQILNSMLSSNGVQHCQSYHCQQCHQARQINVSIQGHLHHQPQTLLPSWLSVLKPWLHHHSKHHKIDKWSSSPWWCSLTTFLYGQSY